MILLKNKTIKRLFVFIVFDILLIGLLYLYQIFSINQLKSEVRELSNLDITKDRYNSANICFGSYRIVEDTIKDYLDDFAVHLQNASNLVTDEEFNNILSYKNIEVDSPNFEVSLTYLESVREKYNKEVEYLLGRLEEDTIKSAINSRTNNAYYRNLYVELMLEDNMLLEFYSSKQLLVDTKKYVITYIDTSEELLNFLKEHPDSWFLEEGEVKFKNHDDYNSYLTLLNKIQENEDKYSSKKTNS